jgi:hypothetical protein
MLARTSAEAKFRSWCIRTCTKLGMCVRVLPPGSHFAVEQIDSMWNLHDERLHEMFNFVATLGEARK